MSLEGFFFDARVRVLGDSKARYSVMVIILKRIIINRNSMPIRELGMTVKAMMIEVLMKETEILDLS